MLLYCCCNGTGSSKLNAVCVSKKSSQRGHTFSGEIRPILWRVYDRSVGLKSDRNLPEPNTANAYDATYILNYYRIYEVCAIFLQMYAHTRADVLTDDWTRIQAKTLLYVRVRMHKINAYNYLVPRMSLRFAYNGLSSNLTSNNHHCLILVDKHK